MVVIIVNRAATAAYDGIVMILTVARTMELRKQASQQRMVQPGVLNLLLRDGMFHRPSRVSSTNPILRRYYIFLVRPISSQPLSATSCTSVGLSSA